MFPEADSPKGLLISLFCHFIGSQTIQGMQLLLVKFRHDRERGSFKKIKSLIQENGEWERGKGKMIERGTSDRREWVPPVMAHLSYEALGCIYLPGVI